MGTLDTLFFKIIMVRYVKNECEKVFFERGICMDYNKKVRVHGNGLVEIRLYEKCITIGRNTNVSSNKKKQPFERELNPFLEEVLKMRTETDSEGWVSAYERDSISLSKSVKRTKDKIFDYSNAIVWEWFCTFTFNPEKVDRTNFDEVSKKMTKWLNNMRTKYCPDMKYVLVPEKHKDGCYHFHGLFSDCDGLDFVPAMNLQETYKGKTNKYYMQPLVRKGQQVFDIKRFKMGYTDCTKVRDTKKVANYILKYVTKEMICDTPNKKRYWCSNNLPKPQESVELHDFEYDSYVESVICECGLKNPDTYCNTFEVENGDFKNRITYIYL